MSGYFSRIARQGGARIHGGGESRGHSAKARTDSHLLPIDSEETLLVQPSPTVDPAVPGAVVKDSDAVISNQPRQRRSTKRTTSATDATTEDQRIESARNLPPEPVQDAVSFIKPEAPRDLTGALTKPEAPTPENVRDVGKQLIRDDSPQTASSSTRVEDTTEPKPVEKKFFKRTAEITEGQTAEPAEVHTVLLREVQEWIAAAETGPDEVIPDVRDFEDPLSDDPTPSERQPGVVRIVDGRRSKAAPEVFQEVSTATLSEQNLELSIGSISVIVEGEERQPQPAPAPTAPQPGASETPQRTSSLSRHYL